MLVSDDIERIIGISNWDKTARWKSDYPPFRDELMKELQAACDAVLIMENLTFGQL